MLGARSGHGVRVPPDASSRGRPSRARRGFARGEARGQLAKAAGSGERGRQSTPAFNGGRETTVSAEIRGRRTSTGREGCVAQRRDAPARCLYGRAGAGCVYSCTGSHGLAGVVPMNAKGHMSLGKWLVVVGLTANIVSTPLAAAQAPGVARPQDTRDSLRRAAPARRDTIYVAVQSPPPTITVQAPPATVTVEAPRDRKSTRLNSSHTVISYAVFCLKK